MERAGRNATPTRKAVMSDADARRREMRERDQGFTALVDNLRAVFGQPHAVVVDGKRYGKEPMWFRRNQQHQPAIPGVTDGGH